MNVALVTPMVASSAIARVMTDAALAFDERWSVDIWCPDLGRRFAPPLTVHDFGVATQEVTEQLARYDLVVYAVGDHPWHAEVVRLARALPGLVVLHDVAVTNLVGAMHASRDTFHAMVADARSRYGDDVADALAGSSQSSDDPCWAAICEAAPFTHYVLQGALGVVVHSPWAARRVEGMTLGAASIAPLPIPGAVGGIDAPASKVLDAALGDEGVVIATVGSVNANRRLDLLLEAVAGDELLRREVRLVAAGAARASARTSLRRLAEQYGLEQSVFLPGAVSDADLGRLLERADVCAALRDPVLESMSASLLTQMRSGKPVVVLDHGHYADLSDDLVVKVPPGDASALRVALRALVDDGARAEALGLRARRFVLERHDLASYAGALVAAGSLALAARPSVDMARRLGDRLREAGLDDQAVIRSAVTDTAFDLFGLR